MIKSENGFVHMNGSTATRLTDLTSIICALDSLGIERDLVEHAVELAYKSDEELRKEAEDCKKKLASRILRAITEGLDETAKASHTELTGGKDDKNNLFL